MAHARYDDRSAEFIPLRSAGLRPAAASYIQDPVALSGGSGPSPQTLGRYQFIPLQRPNQKVRPNRQRASWFPSASGARTVPIRSAAIGTRTWRHCPRSVPSFRPSHRPIPPRHSASSAPLRLSPIHLFN